MKNIILTFLLILFCSCTSLQNYIKEVPNFDQKTYETLTYLKADLLMFYDTFDESVDDEIYKNYIRTFNRMYEYEKGKTGNEEISEQLLIIKNMFNRHYNEIISKNSVYSITMIENKKELIIIAFDVIISTEYLKKRN